MKPETTKTHAKLPIWQMQQYCWLFSSTHGPQCVTAAPLSLSRFSQRQYGQQLQPRTHNKCFCSGPIQDRVLPR